MKAVKKWGAPVALLLAYGSGVAIFHEQAAAAVTTLFTFIGGLL